LPAAILSKIQIAPVPCLGNNAFVPIKRKSDRWVSFWYCKRGGPDYASRLFHDYASRSGHH
jgi:hypothetical protein